MMYRCVICQQLFPVEHILNHVKTHDNFWSPTVTIPGTIDDFKERFSLIGLDIIEEVEEA